MDDQGTEIVLGYFKSEEAANSTIGNISLLPQESQDFYGQTINMRAFKLSGNRYVDQSAEYFVREIDIEAEALKPEAMTVDQYMREEAEANHKAYIDADVKTDDLC